MKWILLSLVVLLGPAAFALEGEYRVPVQDPALEKYAVTAIKQMSWKNADGEVRLAYHLSEELTGSYDSAIVLKGSSTPEDGVLSLRGDNGEAECLTEKSGLVRCHIEYDHLAFNPGARDVLLAERYSDPVELNGRIMIARRFEADPIGVLSFQP